MGIRFAPLAIVDLEGIGDFIAQDNPSRAYSFVREIRQQCEQISDFPLRYRARPELGEAIRSCAFGNYVILFRPEYTDVLIVRILHGALDITRHMTKER